MTVLSIHLCQQRVCKDGDSETRSLSSKHLAHIRALFSPPRGNLRSRRKPLVFALFSLLHPAAAETAGIREFRHWAAALLSPVSPTAPQSFPGSFPIPHGISRHWAAFPITHVANGKPCYIGFEAVRRQMVGENENQEAEPLGFSRHLTRRYMCS